MSTIVITGNTLTLKADFTLETLQKLRKYRPSAMKLMDDKEKMLFKVDVAAEGPGVISEKAIYFAPVTHDAEKKAVVTVAIPADVKNAKEFAADLIGPAYENFAALETAIAGASDEVDAAKAEMLERISQQ